MKYEIDQNKTEKILKRRSQLKGGFLLIFILLAIFMHGNFQFSDQLYNACFYIISFNIALLLVMAIKDFPKRLNIMEEAGINLLIQKSKESFEKEISLLKSKKIKEAQKEFQNQSDKYEIVFATQNNFILNIVLSISLSLFYISFYFIIKQFELLNKFILIPYLEINISFGNLLLIVAFFWGIYCFVKAVLHVSYIFLDIPEKLE